MNKKILISLSVIGAVAAIAVGGTIAYFSDTETSTGNTFTAGAIDLKIDNDSYVTDNDGKLVYSENTSWGLSDSENGLFDGKLFFNFTDLKPGDIGEDTISLHVYDNDAWVCLTIDMTENSDNTCTEPELEDDANCPDGGELAENLQIAVWADDGDNVFEEGERLLQLGGVDDPIVTIQELAGQGVLTLADSGYSVFSGDGNPGIPLTGGQTYHLAKAWCFGTLTPAPVAQDDNDPLVNTGFTCDGAAVNNAAQTDRVMGDMQFYAVQSRNNSTFQCGQR